jgi:hypothetical protein
MGGTPPDSRTIRLWDLKRDQRVTVKCVCGRSVHFLPGTLQRHHRVPSDTLIYDLRFRLKCRKCNSRQGIEVSVERIAGD